MESIPKKHSSFSHFVHDLLSCPAGTNGQTRENIGLTCSFGAGN